MFVCASLQLMRQLMRLIEESDVNPDLTKQRFACAAAKLCGFTAVRKQKSCKL
jgi:hypothetical protein